MPTAGATAIIVDPPVPIEHQVTVQLIQTSLGIGGPTATAFGNTSQRLAIETAVDEVWAQAGIDVDFIDEITLWESSTGYWGGGTAASTPSSLSPLFNAAGAAGVLSEDPNTLNLILVNQVPLFGPHSPNSAAGVAYVNGNGIAQWVGGSLLTFDAGRDVVASVVAHEIGHNLGLDHTPDGLANLMSPQGTSEQLTAAQADQAIASRFVASFAGPAPGDFNGDNAIDASDYTVWRDDGGPAGGTSAEYAAWSSSFTAPPPLAGFEEDVVFGSVPEPTGAALLAVAVLGVARRRHG